MRLRCELMLKVAVGIVLSLVLVGCGSRVASTDQAGQETATSKRAEREADAIGEGTTQGAENEADDMEEPTMESADDARGTREADAISDNNAIVDDSGDSSPEAVEPEAEAIAIGETKVTDDYELTILSAEWADEVYPDTSKTASTYMYFADEEGKSYYLVKFSFHNLMPHFYDFQDHPVTTEQQFVFNDSYQFAAAVYDPEVTGLFTSGVCYSVEPLDTRTYYIIASISDEIRNDMQSGQLSFNLKRITATDAEHYTVDDSYMGKYLVDLMQ